MLTAARIRELLESLNVELAPYSVRGELVFHARAAARRRGE